MAADLDAALARLGGDRSLLRDLLALFQTRTPVRLQDLAAALEAGDRAGFRRIAHSLKGTAASVGGSALEAAAKEAEAAAAGDAALEPHLHSVQAAADVLLAWLRDAPEARV